MKSFYSILFIFGIFIAVGLGFTPEEKREAEKKVLESCKDSEKATDQDINNLLDRKIPQNQSGKCLLKCAHEKIGILVDGKFSIENMTAIGAKELNGDESALAILKEMIAECGNITDADICEQSAKIMDCMIKAGVKRGIDPKKGIQELIKSN